MYQNTRFEYNSTLFTVKNIDLKSYDNLNVNTFICRNKRDNKYLTESTSNDLTHQTRDFILEFNSIWCL